MAPFPRAMYARDVYPLNDWPRPLPACGWKALSRRTLYQKVMNSAYLAGGPSDDPTPRSERYFRKRID